MNEWDAASDRLRGPTEITSRLGTAPTTGWSVVTTSFKKKKSQNKNYRQHRSNCFLCVRGGEGGYV